MDVINKIKALAKEREWSEYRLVKESGLSASTIANIYHRNTIPGIPTLEIICTTFGITLSQFFSEGTEISLSPQQELLLHEWSRISPEQQELLLSLMQTMR